MVNSREGLKGPNYNRKKGQRHKASVCRQKKVPHWEVRGK